MDIARQVHDEILVHLEEPKQLHLQQELEHVVAEASPANASSQRVSETTPLVLKAGDATAYIDAAVDLSALDRKLQQEERDALREDQATSALDIAREEAVSLLKISLPMMAGALLGTVSGIVLSMLLGNVSREQSTMVIAASSLSGVASGQVSATLIGGIGMAVDTMCAQSFGAKQYRQFWLFAQAGLLAMAYCVPFIVIIFANGTSILTFLGQDPALASLASFFMRVSLLSVPFTIALTLMANTLIAQGIALPLTIASTVGNITCIPLAYVLGYHTALGYVGIPVAQLVNVIIQNVVVAHVLLKNPVFLQSWPGWQFQQAHGLVKKLWPLGVSSILMVAIQNLGLNIVSVICGLLPDGAIAISASSIGLNCISLAFMPLMGFYAGCTIRVGIALGGSQPRRAMIAARVALATMLLLATITSTVCAIYADSFTHASTTDEATAKAATDLVYVLLLMVPLMACVLTAQAVLSACAKQLLSAQLNFVAMLVIGLPVGWLLGFELSLGAAGLWLGQILGFGLFSIAAGTWIVRQDWKHLAHKARMNAHLHVENAHEEPSPEPRSAHIL